MLFLSVLLLITVWGYSPIGGAAIITVLPAATLAARRLAARLDPIVAVCAGAGLLALGLLALAFLPSASVGRAVVALVLCGFGLGFAVPTPLRGRARRGRRTDAERDADDRGAASRARARAGGDRAHPR